MNPRDIRKYLFDIEKASRLILDFTRGVDRETFLGGELLRSAVERQSMILGEALRQALAVTATAGKSVRYLFNRCSRTLVGRA